MKTSQVAPSGKAKISVNIPERLLFELDKHRKLVNQDRSIWITSSIMEKLANIKQSKKKNEINN